ncbi:hypothetical protein IFM89_034107 [Coptis chinensis]|uniref:Uncharacterized protein n=1 Tax=Coptis chinensis TaxID=261450 RepID=A0A835M5N9_9MAGN|nr:hypothetical protein IFM89_034107 [Coptis chinensis]
MYHQIKIINKEDMFTKCKNESPLLQDLGRAASVTFLVAIWKNKNGFLYSNKKFSIIATMFQDGALYSETVLATLLGAYIGGLGIATNFITESFAIVDGISKAVELGWNQTPLRQLLLFKMTMSIRV